MDRKDFLISACTLCGLGLAVSALDSCSNNSAPVVNFTLDLNSPGNSALHSTNGYVIANAGNTIVINTGSGYRALSLICTHNGCIVTYAGTRGFACPCHGATYSTTGAVTGGPAPSNLPSYTVTQAGTVLTIKG